MKVTNSSARTRPKQGLFLALGRKMTTSLKPAWALVWNTPYFKTQKASCGSTNTWEVEAGEPGFQSQCRLHKTLILYKNETHTHTPLPKQVIKLWELAELECGFDKWSPRECFQTRSSISVSSCHSINTKLTPKQKLYFPSTTQLTFPVLCNAFPFAFPTLLLYSVRPTKRTSHHF